MKRIVSIILAVMILFGSVALAERETPKGVNIGQYITSYYFRKMKICDIVSADFEFGIADFVSDKSAMVDMIFLSIDENNYITSMTFQYDKMSNLVVSIPAIYALRDSIATEQIAELGARYGINADKYWRTAYKDDFQMMKDATRDNPAEWGDYKVYYVDDMKSDSGLSPFLMFTLDK